MVKIELIKKVNAENDYYIKINELIIGEVYKSKEEYVSRLLTSYVLTSQEHFAISVKLDELNGTLENDE